MRDVLLSGNVARLIKKSPEFGSMKNNQRDASWLNRS